MSTVKDLATELYKALEVAQRDGGESYWRRKDGSPEWMTEVCHAAHGDMLPDDWRYSVIAECAEQLAEGTDVDRIRDELEAEPYYHQLNAWLSSNARRAGYVDQMIEEMGGQHSKQGISGDIAFGQIFEKGEVLSLLVRALEDRVDEDE